MQRLLRTSLLSIAVAACAGQPYAFRQDPAYATLPRVNLTATAHTLGPDFERPVRDLRYGVESELARRQIAAATPFYDERLPVIHLDVIDRGSVSMHDDRLPLPFMSELGNEFGEVYSRADHGVGRTGVGDTRIVDMVVELSEPGARAPETIGRMRVVIVNDFATAEKTAGMVADLVQRRLERPR
jgi:hypothetical protein